MQDIHAIKIIIFLFINVNCTRKLKKTTTLYSKGKIKGSLPEVFEISRSIGKKEYHFPYIFNCINVLCSLDLIKQEVCIGKGA